MPAKLFRNIITIIFATLISSQSFAIHFDQYPAQEIPTQEAQKYDNLGKYIVRILLNQGFGDCSGVLVGPKQILTAAHCFRDTNLGYNAEEMAASKINAERAYFDRYCRRTGCPRVTLRNFPEAAGQFFQIKTLAKGETGFFNDFKNEWILLELTVDVDTNKSYEAKRWLPVDAMSEADFAQIKVLGSPSGTTVVEISQCPAKKKNSGQIAYNCSTEPGSSGGAIISATRSTPVVVGVHSGSSGDASRNHGVLISKTEAQKINAALAAARK